ncbi:MAG: DMT family transporter [Candidatus Hodarchaeales archaeon]|jgi:drug/metabolite transporter (DMT)-like permease
MAKTISYIALGIGLMATSWSSIFIRLTPDTPPLVIAFWRQFLATIGTIFLVFLFKQQNELINVELHKIKLLTISGLFLGIHFGSWFLSLFFTTVTQSVTIVSLSPLIVVISSFVFLRERINRWQVIGIILSIVGGLILSFGNLESNDISSNPLLGNFLAFIGAITVAGYILIGRLFRGEYKMGLFSYTAWVYAFSSLMLFILAIVINPHELLQSFIGQLPFEAYMFFFLLALGPSILGHTMYNFALRDIKAVIISIMTLGEPIITSFLAIIILEEIPTLVIAFGGALTLLGVGITIWMEGQDIQIHD